MNKICTRCQKVVYPIEELKCLDKIWHKTCFKCTECSMTLNMKTYKGYSKLPYCEAHIPKAKATTIADTPELKRIAENTKIQSNAKYHEDFQKAKGKCTQVADDPETLRIKQNTKIISNVAYHGELEKKAAMEKQREAAEFVENRFGINLCLKDAGSPSHINTASGIYESIISPEHIGSWQQYRDQSPQSRQLQQILQGCCNQPLPCSQKQGYEISNKQNIRIYRAMYDYVAQDIDEVSFCEGDVIFEVDSIDSGWLTGRVERTGKIGMLPANYVEETILS